MVLKPLMTTHETMSKQSNNTFQLNMDFSQAVCLRPDNQQWATSPAEGVSRVPLERVAEESGHVTSFVKFEPGAHFPPHTHPNGEEVFVLDGVFSAEQGDSPAGTGLRSPHMSTHFPCVEEETLIYVKVGHLPID